MDSPVASRKQNGSKLLHLSVMVRVNDTSGGVAQYGIAVESRRNNVRWGYAFNDGHTWDTEEGDAVRS